METKNFQEIYDLYTSDVGSFSKKVIERAKIAEKFSNAYAAGSLANGNENEMKMNDTEVNLPSLINVLRLTYRFVCVQAKCPNDSDAPTKELEAILPSFAEYNLNLIKKKIAKSAALKAEPDRFPHLTKLLSN